MACFRTPEELHKHQQLESAHVEPAGFTGLNLFFNAKARSKDPLASSLKVKKTETHQKPQFPGR